MGNTASNKSANSHSHDKQYFIKLSIVDNQGKEVPNSSKCLLGYLQSGEMGGSDAKYALMRANCDTKKKILEADPVKIGTIEEMLESLNKTILDLVKAKTGSIRDVAGETIIDEPRM